MIASILALIVLQDPKVEALEKRIADLERKMETLERALRAFLEGQAALRTSTDRAIARAKEASCANNLRALWSMQASYAEKFGKKRMPDATGPEFWLVLSKTQPPIVGESMLDVYVCPLKGGESRTGHTDYRGPAKKVADLKPDEPVGCCVHPGGAVNAVYKSGDVKTLGPEDPAAKAAVDATRAN